MTEAAQPIREVDAPRKRTTAGRLRDKFNALIDRDQQLINNHEEHILTLRLQVNAWNEALGELNSDAD